MARLSDIDYNMKHQACLKKISDSICVATDVMKNMGMVCNDTGEFANNIRDFQQQMLRAGVMMDSLDGSDPISVGDDDEEINRVLDSLLPKPAVRNQPQYVQNQGGVNMIPDPISAPQGIGA